MSEGWAAQLAGQNIGVSALCPGFVQTRIHESRRNRPDAYGADGPDANQGLEQTAVATSAVQNGIPVGPVGARVVEAIHDNDLYIFTHPDMRPFVEMRFARILEAFDKSAKSPSLGASTGN